LLPLLGALVVLITAPSWLLVPSMPTYSSIGVQFLVRGGTLAALLVFAIVTALMNMRQRTRWLVVFAVVIIQSLNLHALQLVAFAQYWRESPELFGWLRDQTALQSLIELGTVLAIHLLLWPIRIRLGWQVHWAGEAPAPQERLLTIWHLAGSVAFVVLLFANLESRNDILVEQSASLLGNLAVGLPMLILATQRRHLAFWIPAVLAGLVGLTLAEWGLNGYLSTVSRHITGFSLWNWASSNSILAGAVLVLAFLLRWTGLRFHLPLTRPKKSPEMPTAIPCRRKFQFTLRSVFLLTTLACLGPGSYIAWERERCRQGSEVLARIEEVLGQQNPAQQRPAWLQALIGSHRYRHLRLIFSRRATTTDADLACLEGMPNLDTLLLDGTQVTGVWLDSLSRAKNLVTLQLSGTQVSDESLVHFAPLSELRHITLSKTQITDAGLVHLSGLTNVRTLHLDHTNVTDQGMVHLSPLINLENLGLNNTGVGDAGVNQLPVNLKKLGISGTKVTDTGLANISRFTELDYLNLSDNPITDAGLLRLEDLPNLKYLTVKNTQVTDEGVARLQKTLPNCKIDQ